MYQDRLRNRFGQELSREETFLFSFLLRGEDVNKSFVSYLLNPLQGNLHRSFLQDLDFFLELKDPFSFGFPIPWDDKDEPIILSIETGLFPVKKEIHSVFEKLFGKCFSKSKSSFLDWYRYGKLKGNKQEVKILNQKGEIIYG